jgi:hypothetical protein
MLTQTRAAKRLNISLSLAGRARSRRDSAMPGDDPDEK